MIDLVWLALRGMRWGRVRTLITVVGIVIGISAVVSLTAISRGFQTSVEQLFEEFGSDTLTIVGGKGVMTSSLFAPTYFSERELEVVRRTGGVRYAGGIAAATVTLEYIGERKAVLAYGLEKKTMETVFGKMYRHYLTEGRLFSGNNRREVILGYTVANDLFKKIIGIGRTVKINGQEFRVVGVLRQSGNPQDDMSVTIPLQAFKEVTGKASYLMIVAKVSGGSNAERVAENIKRKLRRIRGKEDFTIQRAQDLASQVNSILNVVGLVVLSVAAISLVVGGLGIMNTMYMSVVERTREIGIMKALGATRGQILAVFLLEAGMIGLVGGLIGEVSSIIFVKVAESFIRDSFGLFNYEAYLGADLVLGSLLFSFTLGIVSGLLPSRKAANLEPAKALHHE